MSESTWFALFEKIQALTEHQQGRLSWGGVTILVERRGQVIVAMREIGADQRRSALPSQPFANIESAQDCQFLYIAGKHFLCSWRRQPTHWDWLKALAAFQI